MLGMLLLCRASSQMTISKKRAEKCVTHYYGCDCREYRYQEMESALTVIYAWASPEQSDTLPWIDQRAICFNIANIAKEALECLSKQP